MTNFKRVPSILELARNSTVIMIMKPTHVHSRQSDAKAALYAFVGERVLTRHS